VLVDIAIDMLCISYGLSVRTASLQIELPM